MSTSFKKCPVYDSFTFTTYVHFLDDDAHGGADSIAELFAPLPGTAPDIEEDHEDKGQVVEPIGRLQAPIDDDDPRSDDEEVVA